MWDTSPVPGDCGPRRSGRGGAPRTPAGASSPRRCRRGKVVDGGDAAIESRSRPAFRRDPETRARRLGGRGNLCRRASSRRSTRYGARRRWIFGRIVRAAHSALFETVSTGTTASDLDLHDPAGDGLGDRRAPAASGGAGSRGRRRAAIASRAAPGDVGRRAVSHDQANAAPFQASRVSRRPSSMKR